MKPKRILTGIISLLIAGLVIFAQQQGWIKPNPDASSGTTRPNTPNRSPVVTRDAPETSDTPAAQPSATTAARTDFVLDRGTVRRLFEAKQSDQIITVNLEVEKVLPDDNEGSRHQRFLANTGDGIVVKIAHNIDLADRVPMVEGDVFRVKGEYEWNDLGGVLHWTHHDPKGWRDGGWIEFDGTRYE